MAHVVTMDPAADDGDVRRALRALLDERGLTLAAAARGVGVSPPALSSWAAGKYRGDNARLDRLVRRWLDTEAEVAALRVAGLDRHAELAVTSEIELVATHARANADLALVYGAAGAGKTWALRRVAERTASAWYVAMSPAVTTPAATLARIARALDVGAAETTAARLERAIVAHLRGRSALLIVDEAHQLTAALLDVVRCVYDQAACGVVLSGNDPLWSRLSSGERAAQLVSRVGIRRRLRRPSDADALALAAALTRSRVSGAARAAVLTTARGVGGLRAVRKLVAIAGDFASGAERARITAEDLVDAAARLEEVA